MTREKRNYQQSVTNEIVINIYSLLREEIQSTSDVKRLRKCNAFVTETEHYFVLTSYETVIACIDKETHALYDFLRMVYGYTSTSAQHISKFRHVYTPYPWDYSIYTARPI